MARLPVHRILLTDPRAPRGMFVTHSRFPVPRFGDRCVCCDARDAAPVPYDPSGDQQLAGRIEIPVCDACEDHVSRSHTVPQLATIGIAIGGIATLVFGVITVGDVDFWPTVVCSAAPLAAGIATFAAIAAARGRRAAAGHHAIDVLVQPGSCAVITTNARLAEELLDRNPSARRVEAGRPSAP